MIRYSLWTRLQPRPNEPGGVGQELAVLELGDIWEEAEDTAIQCLIDASGVDAPLVENRKLFDANG